MEPSDPTFLGRVAAVSGSTITVRLSDAISSGLAIIGGHAYRVGQVGAFVRIPQGYHDLYGVVCEVGADPVPAGGISGRWIKVELVGEALGGCFERGISQHPGVDDPVHLATERDLGRIYWSGGEDDVRVGVLSSAEGIATRLSLDAIVTRHVAVVGSTGSGKSTAVTSLLRSIAAAGFSVPRPSTRILLLDLHGEYATALGDLARVYSASPRPGERSLYVPFWALEVGELLDFLIGGVGESQRTAFEDKIAEMKTGTLAAVPVPGLDANSLTVDSPVPFSLKQLWYDLVDFELTTYGGPNRDQPQLETLGDAASLRPPKYKKHALGAAGPFLNQAARGIKRPLDQLRSRLLDRRFDFLLHPGNWEPALDGSTTADLDVLLADWLGNEKPITILDLSAVPSAVLPRMVSSILRIIYEAVYWSREKSEGGVARPLLVVMEEAHRYLAASGDVTATGIVQRIAKEGRKYGIGAMIVSQRPAEVDETILSQCGTIISLRLSNPADRARVKAALPDNLAGLMDMLPVLRTGEAIITGEAARLPMRTRISLPPEEHRPRSEDPQVSAAWSRAVRPEDYRRVVASWRAQRTTAVVDDIAIPREAVDDTT